MSAGKTLGKLPWISKIILQKNGIAAIPKIPLLSLDIGFDMVAFIKGDLTGRTSHKTSMEKSRLQPFWMSKIINRLLAICEWLAFAICTCLLVAVLYDSFDNYFKYPTGNSIVQSNQELLPFPAITICSSHYEWGKAYQVFMSPVSQYFILK